jgi:hypothetical protein
MAIAIVEIPISHISHRCLSQKPARISFSTVTRSSLIFAGVLLYLTPQIFFAMPKWLILLGTDASFD